MNIAHLHETRLDQIVAELHDGVCQQLVSILWELESLKLITEQDEKVDNLEERMRTVITDLQQIIYNQRPLLIDKLGLIAGVKEWVQGLLRDQGIRFTFHNDSPSVPVSRFVEGQIFRMIQEGVNNIIRHAKATEVSLSLAQEEESYNVELVDNGRGFDPNRTTGLGLQILRERAVLIQGELLIKTEPGKGTCLQILIPNKDDVK